jgi:hypothetical protein
MRYEKLGLKEMVPQSKVEKTLNLNEQLQIQNLFFTIKLV